MQIGSKSNTYLKQIQSRAKMHEYHVAEKDYVQIEEKAQWIIISAIDIICEFAEEIIESEANIQMDWKKYMVKLRFAMRFFDSFSKSELAGGNVEYFELLGSAIYYLGGRNGSSKVMADNISDDLDLECSSIDKTLLAILRMDKEYEYEGTNELLIEIVAELKRSLNYGDQFNYKNLKKFREEVYLYGSNREVIFSDILIAVIYLKLYNSAYCLLPLYTGVEKKIWKDILNRNTLVKELWAAQKELGENDIFRGKSATIQMPTGSGKTKSIALIIESAFLMQRTTEVMIVTPFRSLCREITDELSNAFSYTENISVTAISDILQEDYIGVLERYEMPIYNIYVLTPEKLSFMIRQSNDVMKNVGLIIFDEGHLFDDLHRGMQYELLVSLIKNQLGEYVQTILISAVLPNAYEINEWLTESEGSIVKNNAIVTTEKTISFAEEKNNTIYLHFVDSENPEVEDFYVPRVITPQELETSKREKRKVFPDLKKSNDVSIALALKLCMNGGTAIFIGNKLSSKSIVNRILDIERRGINIESFKLDADKKEVENISELIGVNIGRDTIFYEAAKKGVFVHHGDMPIGIRASVEYAMQKGLIRFIICTSTLAQGVNLPIRYLIISSAYQGGNRIKTRDFQNLIGRAGRAGMYTEGTIIISETDVYKWRKSYSLGTKKWKWDGYKELISGESMEECSSVLLDWIRKQEKELGEQEFREWFEQNYKNKKFEKESCQIIEALESFLLFYLIEDKYIEVQEKIYQVITKTLAYSLADKEEQQKLIQMVDILGNYLMQIIETPEKRYRYSKSLLGVQKEIEIENWVKEHIENLIISMSSEEIFDIIFPLLMKEESKIVERCKNYDDLKEIGHEWIKGRSYQEILQITKVENMEIYNTKSRKYVEYTIQEIISFCDNFLSYQCTLVMAAVLENTMYLKDDKKLNKKIKKLSQFLRYGLSDNCAIMLYELGINDRQIASRISRIVQKEYIISSKKELVTYCNKDPMRKREIYTILEKIHMHDWNELHTEYSYKDKMFLNEIWSKYGWLHFKNLLYVINQMHITELLPEIILPLNESLRKCGENYADCKEMIKANAVIINKIITKAFLDFNDDIKCDHELVKAFEEVLETLVGFGMEEAAVILDEFRVH